MPGMTITRLCFTLASQTCKNQSTTCIKYQGSFAEEDTTKAKSGRKNKCAVYRLFLNFFGYFPFSRKESDNLSMACN